MAAMVAVMIVVAAGMALAVTEVGTNASETIPGTAGLDQLYGLGGDDTIRGFAEDDKEIGGTGADTLFGGLGDDRQRGGIGKDIVYGGNGYDESWGQEGADILKGGDQNDRLHARDGIPNNDFVIGGGGTEDHCYADSMDEINKETCENIHVTNN